MVSRLGEIIMSPHSVLERLQSGILCLLLGFQFERNLEKLKQIQNQIRKLVFFFFFLVMFGGDAKVKLQSSEFMKMTDPNKCQAKI